MNDDVHLGSSVPTLEEAASRLERLYAEGASAQKLLFEARGADADLRAARSALAAAEAVMGEAEAAFALEHAAEITRVASLRTEAELATEALREAVRRQKRAGDERNKLSVERFAISVSRRPFALVVDDQAKLIADVLERLPQFVGQVAPRVVDVKALTKGWDVLTSALTSPLAGVREREKDWNVTVSRLADAADETQGGVV